MERPAQDDIPSSEDITEGFVRSPRIAPPRVPGGEITLQPPPEVPRVIPGGLVGKLLPVVMVIAVVGMIALMLTSGSSMLSNPLTAMFPLMMLVSMFGMYSGGHNSNGKRSSELNEDRKDYLRYLGHVRNQTHTAAAEQRNAFQWLHPEPTALADIIGSQRMWERRPTDPDFGQVRIGVGSQRLATRLLPPETGPVEDIDPVATLGLRRFVRRQSVVHDLPIAIALRSFPAISLEGDDDVVAAVLRSTMLSAAAMHGPDHLAIAVAATDPEAQQWSWAKWLPHNGHPRASDAFGPTRMIYSSVAALEAALAPELAARGRFSRSSAPHPTRPHLVVIIAPGTFDGQERLIADAGIDGVTIVDLRPVAGCLSEVRGVQLVVSSDAQDPQGGRGGHLGARSAAGVEMFATPDALPHYHACALARRLARYRVATAAQLIALDAEAHAVDPGLMALIDIPDAAAITPAAVWRPRSPRSRLRVPIGVTATGEKLELDIKESAENGMGPHGLCIGATGSGKSEFLRTLVLSMVATHSPEVLNLVLVDFKGGATFLGLDSLQHVAAVITNLEEEIALVDRMRDALAGELTRRQEVLRRAGNFANVGDYERARAAGAQLDPLPALFIVVDEFTELLTQRPDFAELFVAIGRLGRSLHVHLLLASQRLEEGRMRGLDSHLSYRIGLKNVLCQRITRGAGSAGRLPPTVHPRCGLLEV